MMHLLQVLACAVFVAGCSLPLSSTVDGRLTELVAGYWRGEGAGQFERRATLGVDMRGDAGARGLTIGWSDLRWSRFVSAGASPETQRAECPQRLLAPLGLQLPDDNGGCHRYGLFVLSRAAVPSDQAFVHHIVAGLDVDNSPWRQGLSIGYSSQAASYAPISGSAVSVVAYRSRGGGGRCLIYQSGGNAHEIFP